MPHYLLAYHGGARPSSKEEGVAQMEKWRAWVDRLGDKVINPGVPLMDRRQITSSAVEESADPEGMKGFAVIEAENLDEAVAIARTDPFLETGGAIHLYQMMSM